MPLKIDKRCTVCQTIEAGDVDLLRRIYRSSKFVAGGESITQIAQDYTDKFKYGALARHSSRHQTIHESDLKTSTLNKIAQNGANAAVLAVVKHGDVRKLVMEKGYKQIKSGKIKLKASDVIKAAKDDADIELKTKDQGLQVMEMMMKFQSGELQERGDEDADSPGSGNGPIEGQVSYTPGT